MTRWLVVAVLAAGIGGCTNSEHGGSGGGGSGSDGAPGRGGDSGPGPDDGGGPDGTVSPDGGGGSGGGRVIGDRTTCALPSNTGLVDLGHAAWIFQTERSGDRLVTRNNYYSGNAGELHNGLWRLWDLETGLPIADGTEAVSVALSGATLAIQRPSSIVLRSAATGAVTGTVALATPISRHGLATDGSYLWIGRSSGLQVWSSSGQLLWQRAGDYSRSYYEERRLTFAGPDELRIAEGPAGDNVIEILQVADGARSTTPAFQGTVRGWFRDGQRFVSSTGNTTWIYSRDAVQVQIANLPVEPPQEYRVTAGGIGDIFWRRTGDSNAGFEIYRVGSSTPEATAPIDVYTDIAFEQDECVGVVNSESSETYFVRLTPEPLATQVVDPPLEDVRAATCTGAGALVMGSADGAVVAFDPAGALQPTPLACGEARDIGGSHAGVATVATASGEVLVIDVEPGGGTIRTSLPLNVSETQLSSDGTVMAVSGNRHDYQYWTDKTVSVLSLVPGQEGDVIASWPYTVAALDPDVDVLDLSSDGQWLAQQVTNHRLITDVTGATVLLDDYQYGLPHLEADGSAWAYVSGSGTQIFENGTLVGGAVGQVVDWVNSDRLLVWRVVDPENSLYVVDAVDRQGVVTREAVATGYRSAFSTVPDHPSWVYLERQHTIFDIETGAAVWPGPAPAAGIAHRGAVAGSQVVFVDGPFIRSVTY